MADLNTRSSWAEDDTYWRTNYRSRPYAAGREYDYYQPDYRDGYGTVNRFQSEAGTATSTAS